MYRGCSLTTVLENALQELQENMSRKRKGTSIPCLFLYRCRGMADRRITRIFLACTGPQHTLLPMSAEHKQLIVII